MQLFLSLFGTSRTLTLSYRQSRPFGTKQTAPQKPRAREVRRRRPSSPRERKPPGYICVSPRNLQTIFSPSKQDIDLAHIQRQFDDLNERIYKLEQENCRQNRAIVELEQKIVELEQKNDQLNDDSRRHQSSAEQLRILNTSILKRIVNLEEVKGFKTIFQNAAEWATPESSPFRS